MDDDVVALVFERLEREQVVVDLGLLQAEHVRGLVGEERLDVFDAGATELTFQVQILMGAARGGATLAHRRPISRR